MRSGVTTASALYLSTALSGAEPVSGSPEEAAALIRREIDVNGAFLKELGISPESD
jgi:hypothetical protein